VGPLRLRRVGPRAPGENNEQAAQARRAVRAAAGGKKAPAAQPGGLREKVLAHLRDYPGSSFTPHEIHKVNGHSSGAIANALDTLVKHGDAELATEKPRRFRLAGNAAAPAGPQPPAEPAAVDTDAGQAADLAGAA
jgi:aspartate/methionine/tyrosine aminotransferase